MRHLINQIFLLVVLVWGGFVAAQGSETGDMLSFGEEAGLSWSSSTAVLAYEEIAPSVSEGAEAFFVTVDDYLFPRSTTYVMTAAADNAASANEDTDVWINLLANNTEPHIAGEDLLAGEDTCPEAIVVTDGYSENHTNVGTNSSNGDVIDPGWTQGTGFHHGVHNAIWFRYVGQGVPVHFSTAGSQLDTEMVINSTSDGSCDIATFTHIAGTDDPPGGGLPAKLTIFGEQDVVYYILVDGQGPGSVGNFVFSVTEYNDSFTPDDTTVDCNSDATFTLNGTPSPGVSITAIQWQRSPNIGGPYTNIPSATSISYTLSPAVNADNGHYFRAIYTLTIGSNNFSNSESDPALLTVTPPPAVVTTTGVSCSGGLDGVIMVNQGCGTCTTLEYSITGPVTVGPQGSNSFSGLPEGTYTVTVTDSGNAGCTATATNVVIGIETDGTPPSLTCPSAIIPIVLDLCNEITISPADIPGLSATDNCDTDVALSLSQTMFTDANLGNQSITVTATDDVPNQSTCSVTLDIQQNPEYFEITAGDDAFEVCATSSVTFTDAQLLVNDNITNTDGLEVVDVELVTPGEGTLVDNNNGTYTFTANGSVSMGTVALTYSVISDSAPEFFPGTGHFYEYIASPNTNWFQARDAAAAMTLYGLQGYLATITSQGENDFAAAKLNGSGWIGGSEQGNLNTWTWRTGPESGDIFWLGGNGGSSPTYANWAGGEPNNASENCAHFFANGTWNDGPCTHTGYQGYVVEYGTTTGCMPPVSASANITVTVNGTPDIAPVSTQMNTCPASATFDLTSLTITDNNSVTGTTTTFHTAAPTSATDNSTLLSGAALDIAADQTIFVRVANTTTGCFDVASFQVDIVACCDIAISSATPTAETCSGLNDGQIEAVATCSTCAGIEYSLSGAATVVPQASGIFTGLASGNYTVTATDTGDGGCTVSQANVIVVSGPSVDFDGDNVPDCRDLDDDNDGILDTEECDVSVASTVFSVEGGAPQTFNLVGADEGFTFDLYYLDNSFNFIINGTPLVPDELQFETFAFTGGESLVGFAPGVNYGNNGIPQVYNINVAPGFVWNGVEEVVVRISIDAVGNVSFQGKRGNGLPLEPLFITSGPGFNTVTWNTNGANTLIIEQKVMGPTRLSGLGFGVSSGCTGTLDTDMDSDFDQVDLDSDNDGCLDVVEAGHNDPDEDGILGTSPVTVDANGLVTGQGGYTGSTDGVRDNTIFTACCEITIEDITITNEICPGAADGAIAVDASCSFCTGSLGYSLSGPVNVGQQASNVFMSLPDGTYTVTVTDTGDAGCSATQANVVVAAGTDTEDPTPVCQDITVNLQAGSTYTLTAAELNGTSTDNCGTTTFSIPATVFDCDDVGNTVSVTLTVDDGNGNDATCVSMVTITDTNTTCCDTDPVLSVADMEVCEGDAGTTDITFTITLQNEVCDPFVVDVSTMDGTAVDVVDYNGIGQNAGIVFGGFDNARASGTSLRTGSSMNNFRTLISNNLPGATITETNVLTPAYLATIDVLVISAWPRVIVLSAAEQTALFEFVRDGGNLFSFQENDGYNGNAEVSNESFIDPFSMDIIGTINGSQNVSIVVPTHPIASGTYGTVTDFNTQFPGWYNNLGPYAQCIGRIDNNNQCALAVIDPDAITPGSGSAVFISDGNGATAAGQAATLMLNAFNILLDNQREFTGTMGETQTITVSVNGDTDVEADETFDLEFEVDGTVITTATATINNDDCVVSGPTTADASAQDVAFSAPAGMTTYTWSIPSGDATLDGNGAANVTVDVGCDDFTIQLSIVDPNGCTYTCTKVVTVTDLTDPVPTCPSGIIPIVLDLCNEITISPADIPGLSATDNCDTDVALSLSQTMFTDADLGNQPITVTAEDDFANRGTCTVTLDIQQNPEYFEITAGDDEYETCSPDAVTITESELLSNDAITNTDNMTVQDVALVNPSDGTLTGTGPWTFTPAANFTGDAALTYTVTSENAPLFSPDNGHFYEYVAAPAITWGAANTAAQGMTLYGQQGYLTTVTSAAENNFILNKLGGNGWMGASDAAVEGEWRWVTGPEAGTQFWQGAGSGAAVGGAYENWNGGEPNNLGGEDYGHFLTNGLWNDFAFNQGAIDGYVVEYGDASDCMPDFTATGNITITVNGTPDIAPVSTQMNTCPASATFDLTSLTITDNNSVTGTTTTFHSAAPTSATDNSTLLSGAALDIAADQTVFVRVANTTTGCFDVASFLVDIESCCDISITSATPTDEVCPDANDGTIMVNATCGVCVSNGTTIQYSLTGPVNRGAQGSPLFENLPDGTYTVTVTDSGNAGCSASTSVTVSAGVDAQDPVLMNCDPVTALAAPGLCEGPVIVPTPTATDNCSNITLGNGLNFDGNNDNALVAATSVINQQAQRRTVEVYFRVNDKNINTRKQVIWEEGGGTNGINLYVFDGQLYYGIYSVSNGWSGVWLSTNTIQSGQWHNAVLVFDGTLSTGRLKAYLDGTLVASANASSSLGSLLSVHGDANAVGNLNNDGVFHDGRVGSQTGQHGFAGDIDEIRLWTVARSAADLAMTNTAQLMGNETGLILYYPMDQGTACGDNSGVTTMDDATATGLNGALSGFNLNGSTGCNSNWTTGSPALNSSLVLTNSYTGTADASSTYPVGTTTVTWTVVDAAGNDATCTQTVTVQAPDLAVTGLGMPVTNGSTSPAVTNDTDFGNLSPGVSDEHTFTITNNGDAPLILTGPNPVSISGSSDWSISGQPASNTIAPGSSETFRVMVTPSTVGAQTATVSIASNDCDVSSYTFQVQVAAACPTLSFSYTPVDESCKSADDGSITFTMPMGAGNGNYEYSIDDGGSWSNDPSFTGLEDGDYVLKIRDADAQSCESSTVEISLGTIDNDCDGIPDVVDIDDDNDGLLDFEEAGCVVDNSSSCDPAQLTDFAYAEFSSQTGNRRLDGTVTSGGQTIGVTVFSTGGFYGDGGSIIDFSNGVFCGTSSYCPTPSGENNFSFRSRTQGEHRFVFSQPVSNPRFFISSLNRVMNLSVPGILVLSDGDFFGASDGDVVTSLDGREACGTISFPGIYTEISFTGVSEEFYCDFSVGIGEIIPDLEDCAADTDMDGIPDYLDLDSDNDGIMDVEESGNGTLDGDDDGIIDLASNATVGTNGLYNPLETSNDSGILQTPPADSDMDGATDAIEIDADNDGCNDVEEAYGVGTDMDGDGEFGAASPAVDDCGRVVAATYATPADGDANSVLDFQQASQALTGITDQPTDATDICSGSGTSFSVVPTLTGSGTPPTYQWQLSTGGAFADISEGGIYSGTNLATLSISEVNTSMNNYQYRVVITTPSYVCDSDQTSSPATLTVSNPGTVAIDDVTLDEGDSGTTSFTFTVTRTNSACTLSVDYATSDNGAVAGADYTATSGTLTFAAGESSQTITVLVNGDTDVEPDDQFTVTLSNATNEVTISDDEGVGTITNDDATELAIDDVSQAETDAANNMVFTVTLSEMSTETITVAYTTNDGTAVAGADFTSTSGTLTFAPGDQSETITVPILGETILEADEIFTIVLGSPTNATISTGTGTGTIVNDDAANITLDDVTITEGTGGTTTAIFTVTLDAAVQGGFDLAYTTNDGTSMAADGDYTDNDGTLSFVGAAGEMQTIEVIIGTDNKVETDETFTVLLGALSNLGAGVDANDITVQADGGDGVITNDDSVNITLDDVTLNEGTGGTTTSFTFTATLDNPVQGGFDLTYITNEGTATFADGDFTDNDGTLTFVGNMGETQTITVLVNHDATVEPDETFTVLLGALSSLGTGIDANDITVQADGGDGIITNDDAAELNIADVSDQEGNGPFNFEVTLSNPLTVDITFTASTADATATLGDIDYTAVSSMTFTIPAGQTSVLVPVSVVDDNVNEPDEVFAVSIANALGSPDLSVGDGIATGTILNDDEVNISIDDVTVVEGNAGQTAMVFTVTLDAMSSQLITVDYTTQDGDATTLDNDYSGVSGALVFAPGQMSQTITVQALGDERVELDQLFTVELSNPTIATIADGSGTGTIENDDTATIVVDAAGSSVVEGDAGNTPISLPVSVIGGPADVAIVLTYVLNDGTATLADNDFSDPNGGTITIPAGQNAIDIVVFVIGDTNNEDDEAFSLTVTSIDASGRDVALGNATAPAIIIDDDFTCPTLGSISGEQAICQSEQHQLSTTGLMTMAGAENNELDFGIRYVYFSAATADPYTGGTDLGTVPYADLEAGGTEANLEVSFPAAAGDIFVYAVLSPAPAEPTCRPSLELPVTVYTCGITNDDDTNPTISDPCSCKDNATTLIDGQFDELVQVFDAPAGQAWTVVAVDGLFQSASPAPPMAPLDIPLGTMLTEIPTATPGVSDYELTGVHVDGVGYSIMVSNGTTTLALSNRCWYPNPSFDNLAASYCRTNGAVTLMGSAQLGDDSGEATPESEMFMVINVDSGATVVNAAEGSAVLDIANLPAGRYRVIFTFNAADDDPDQNHPGCSQSIEREFEILEVNCGTFPWGGN